MPTASHRYTVVGFSDKLDWRELTFVEPSPPNKICKACGLVTRVTAFLPCLHVFCKKCYEQCRHDSGQCCPLDGQRALEEDVEWIDFPVGNLLKRKVKCWNEDRGCDTVLPASELNKHFCKDCDHHSTSCTRCSMVVGCNNVCAHMQNECRDNMSAASKDPPTDATGERALMMALSAKLNTQVNEMKRSLDHFTHEKNTEINHLNEISHCVNTLKETLLEISSRSGRFDSIASCSEAMHETLNTHGEKLHELERTMSDSHKALIKYLEVTRGKLKADLRELFRSQGNALKESHRKAPMTICGSCAERIAQMFEVNDFEKQSNLGRIIPEKVLALSRINVKGHGFVISGIAAKKKIALSRRAFHYVEKKTYICGYHLSPGVYFTKEGEDVYLNGYIQLHKGMIDNIIQWPLKGKVRLTIKDRTGEKEYSKEQVLKDYLKFYAKPDEAGNEGVYLDSCSFSMNHLQCDGYIVDDYLRVMWELALENGAE